MGRRFVLGKSSRSIPKPILGFNAQALSLTDSPPSEQPLDLTLLDQHFGNITMWQKMVDDVHSRGMYVILDHTMST